MTDDWARGAMVWSGVMSDIPSRYAFEALGLGSMSIMDRTLDESMGLDLVGRSCNYNKYLSFSEYARRYLPMPNLLVLDNAATYFVHTAEGRQRFVPTKR